MTGPDHYRDAERAFENAKAEESGNAKERFFLDAAQFHATMAHAAATALQAALPLVGDDQQVTDWCKAVGVTVDTSQDARISSALELVEEFSNRAWILPIAADKLRAALGKTGGDR
jgi:hypothetical protein